MNFELNLDNIDNATDHIFDRFNLLLLEDRYIECDMILSQLDLSKLPTTLMRSFLTITAPAKDHLPSRNKFFNDVFSIFSALKGEERAEKILGRLR